MYQHENLHTTSYTCKLSKNHWFLLIKSLSMYEKWRQIYVIRHKTKPVFHIILHWTSFLIQTASLFVHGETFNQKESMLFRRIVSIAGCVRSFILVHWTLVFLATPARTTNKTRLNSCNESIQGFSSLTKLSDTFCLENLIRDTTCETSNSSSSVDVILTDKSRSFQNSSTVVTGISDGHKMI